MDKQALRAMRAFAVVCLVALAGWTTEAQRSRTQGLKETEDFVKAGGQVSTAVAEAKLEVQKTLNLYNDLVMRPSKDMKGDYKKLMKSMDSMNQKVDEARTRISGAQKAGDTYFAGRAESVKEVQSAELQDRARQRMLDSQSEFASVRTSLREAGEALEPLRKDLADHITYLGSDLTPSGTASLQPEAKKLNEQGGMVFSKTDTAISKTNSYFKGLQAASE
jgi:Protein of unknown function (DUF2959)